MALPGRPFLRAPARSAPLWAMRPTYLFQYSCGRPLARALSYADCVSGYLYVRLSSR